MHKLIIVFLAFWGIGVSHSQNVTDSAGDTLGGTYSISRPVVTKLVISKAIGPITTRVIDNSIKRSRKLDAEVLIIEMNTPGGQMEATWDIIRTILASEIPIVLYVSPPGSRAASAGVFISYAAHIAVMAPQTNIGSAHPVGMGGSEIDSTLSEKITNDAVAKIKTLASKRKRNGQWAEDAVRNSVSVTEYEAKDLSIINYVATDFEDLIAKIDGDTVDMVDGPKIINCKDADTVEITISFANKVLEVVSDPNIAYILMAIGMLGMYFELANPGSILPGVIGGISLLLALFSFQALPINIAGVLLIVLAIILFLLELKLTSYGLLGGGGVVSMFLGSLMLINETQFPYKGVSLSVIIPTVVVFTLFFFVAAYLALKTHRKKVTTGQAGLKGEIGITKTNIGPEGGKVFVHGELWQAVAASKIESNKKARIVNVEGMTLTVEPCE